MIFSKNVENVESRLIGLYEEDQEVAWLVD